MAKYGGADIEAFARVLEEDVPSGERDWSMDLAYFLAMTLISLNRLEKEGIELSYRSRKLIEPSLKRAWRELVFLRRRRLTEEFVLKDISRSVTLSKRTGRIMIHGDIKSDTTPNWQGRIKIGRRPRFRRKKYKRPISTDAAKLRRKNKSESD